MTMSVTLEEKGTLGGHIKIAIYKIVDDNSGGNVVVPVSHILWADAINITTGSKVATTWTDEEETITLAASTGTVRLIVFGWGG